MIPWKTKWMEKHKGAWSWKVMIITVADDAGDDRSVSSSLFPLYFSLYFHFQTHDDDDSHSRLKWEDDLLLIILTFTLISLLIVLSRDLSHVSVELLHPAWVLSVSVLENILHFLLLSRPLLLSLSSSWLECQFSCHSLLCSWCYSFRSLSFLAI